MKNRTAVGSFLVVAACLAACSGQMLDGKDPALAAQAPGAEPSEREAPASSEQTPSGAAAVSGPPSRQNQSTPAVMATALAVPDEGNGWIDIVITEQATTCEKRMVFPEGCVPASRVRISLPPNLQKPGTYRFGPGDVFAYRDAQGPTPGAWEKGATCGNLGTPIDKGTLRVESI